MSPQALGDHQQARSVFVESVDDTGAWQLRGYRRVMQQRVDQRAIRIAGCRMDDQPGRLVDDQDVVIFEPHDERNVLRLVGNGDLGLDLAADALAAEDRFARFDDATVEAQHAALDPLLDAGAGMVRQQLGQRLVETLAAELGWDDVIDTFRGWHVHASAVRDILTRSSPLARNEPMSSSTARFRFPAALAACLLLATGCSWLPEKVDETKDWSAAKLYSEAKDNLNEGNYEAALNYYEKLQARYPFGRYAQQAQLESIYAYYKDGEADSAIAAADRFIRTYPRHPFVDYAYYLKGLTNFERQGSPLDRVLPPDPTRTDSAVAMQSFNDFNDLVTKFPQSRYAEDARKRMLFLRNNLATYELNVAHFYADRGDYVAAINRAKYIIANYASSPAAGDALAVMARAYIGLGMYDLASDALRVLRQNYPQHPELATLTAQLGAQGKR